MKNIIAQYNKNEEKIDDRASEIFEIYSNHFLQGDEIITFIHVDKDPIQIEWAGPHNSGLIYIPKEAFCDKWEEWVFGEIKKDISAKAAKEKKTKTIQIKKQIESSMNTIAKERDTLENLQDDLDELINNFSDGHDSLSCAKTEVEAAIDKFSEIV